jgi:hypothetical protein
MDYATKLKNFPSVNYISLHKDAHRREYMNSQFSKYGINGVAYLNDYYNDIRDSVTVIPNYCEQWLGGPNQPGAYQLGVTLSHLMMIRKWVDNTNEPYAIFTEDDISFKSIEYWNFTWDDFMTRLPFNWQCVQLIRMENPFGYDTFDRMRLDLRDSLAFSARWWGASWMMTREYATQLIEQHNPEPGVFNLYHHDVMPISENILFYHRGPKVYNFPLVYENYRDIKSSNGPESGNYDINGRSGRDLTQAIVEHLWRTVGTTLDINKAMQII